MIIASPSPIVRPVVEPMDHFTALAQISSAPDSRQHRQHTLLLLLEMVISYDPGYESQ